MSSYIGQLYSHPEQATTPTATMDEDISMSSSDPGVPTPSSSTQSPQPEPLHPAPESEMAIEPRESCPDDCNCASCQLRNRLHDERLFLMLLQVFRSPTSGYTPAVQHRAATPEERANDIMEPGTLEAARQHIAWLTAQLDGALERAAQGASAGMRPSADDEWVINEAGRLLARVVPRMGAPSGAFSLDGGELYVIPDTFWPPPPRATPAGETDHSALARRRMEEFSSRVVGQLEAKKEEQLRAARPLEGALSSPHQKKTSAEAESASKSPSMTEQEQQEQPQQPLPDSNEFQLPPEFWESNLQKGLDLLDQEYQRRAGPLVVSGSMAYRTAPEQKQQQPPRETPVAQTPAEVFSSFLEEQMDLQEQERQRSGQLQGEDGSKPHQTTAEASPPASTPTDAPEQQQQQQPPNVNSNSNPSQTPEPATTSTPETQPSRSIINHQPTADSAALAHACAVVQHHTDAHLYAHRDAIVRSSSSSALQRLTQNSSWQEEVHQVQLRQWAWAREHQFWVPPGGDIRLWAYATASVLYLPPPTDQDIFGY